MIDRLNAPARLAIYGVLLAVVFLGAMFTARAVSPDEAPAPIEEHQNEPAEEEHGEPAEPEHNGAPVEGGQR